MAVSAFSKENPIPLYLDGKQVHTSSTLDVISPLTGQVLHTAAAASESDALAAVAAAHRALPAWAATKPAARRDIFLLAAAEFEKRREELWQFCKNETGSTEPYFAFDFGDMLESLKSCAGLIHSAHQASMPVLGEEGRSAMILQEPYGVVLAVAPWNAPCILGIRSFLGPMASMLSVRVNEKDLSLT